LIQQRSVVDEIEASGNSFLSDGDSGLAVPASRGATKIGAGRNSAGKNAAGNNRFDRPPQSHA
jgi:hypothetical protein